MGQSLSSTYDEAYAVQKKVWCTACGVSLAMYRVDPFQVQQEKYDEALATAKKLFGPDCDSGSFSLTKFKEGNNYVAAGALAIGSREAGIRTIKSAQYLRHSFIQ